MITKQTRLASLERQIARLAGRIAALKRQSEQLTAVRLTLFALGGLGSGIIFVTLGAVVWAVTLFPFFIPFAISVAYHRRVEQGLRRYETWQRIKRQHLARMTLDWEAIPPSEVANVDSDHPFAFDFDLIGERSIHQLLNTAVSREGSQRLANWLLDPLPDLAGITRRQAQVRELVDQSLFRDKLTLFGLFTIRDEGKKQPANQPWAAKQLLDWLKNDADATTLRTVLFVLSGLAIVNVVLLLGNLFAGWQAWWVGSWTLYALIFFTQSRQAQSLFKDAWFIETRLRQLTAVFTHLEQFKIAPDSSLTELLRPFQTEAERPSDQLRRVTRLAAAAGIQQNPILWLLLNLFTPWDLFFAYRLHQVKSQLSDDLPVWLDVWYELEALGALAAFAYLNPATTFPTIRADDACFAAHSLGHPLIEAEQRVGNDFRIEALGSLFILTGSNMSGKSSFLRTLGTNLSLAYAGGSVVAQSLQTSLFRLFAAIRVNDSVVDGFSYFYAEVRRLRMLLDGLEWGERPLFFLIDEIFRGTNNRERLQGSRAYIQALAGKNGVGLIATHDLELVQLADEMPEIANMHFRDAVENGRMVFDYTLRPGPSPTTNALKIMRLAGLPVPEQHGEVVHE
ncbi:MAG: hypothetical protein AAF614_42215 [Chloroflexota bacterium]